jgi:ferredoxin, 2Fe-2S
MRIRFVRSDHSVQEVEAAPGSSLMRVAKDNGITEIVAECGGACMCATCHVTLSDEWLIKSGPRSFAELEMLPFALENGPNSRLSCQVIITEDLDGMEVHLPESQI